MTAHLQRAGSGHGKTDFGRQPNAGTDISLAAALREHAGRIARAEAIRSQLVMGIVGFVGGLALIVPIVLWIVPRPGSILPGATAAEPAAISAQIAPAETSASHTLVSVPTIAIRGASASADIQATSGQPRSADQDPVEIARSLIRSGEIVSARRVLDQPELRQSGQALFMLAETYDPNVLAALGAMGVHAETSMARRYYEAALAEGVVAASPRLEALE